MYLRFLATGLLACAAFIATPAASAADLDGKWNFTITTEGGERTFSPVFKLDGQDVTGKWGTSDVKGKFAGNKLDLDFPFTSEEAGLTGNLKLAGTMADGALAGTWQFETYQGTFKAVRDAAPVAAAAAAPATSSASFAGNWDCTAEADQTYSFTLAFTEEAGTWKGKMASTAGELALQSLKVEQDAASFTIDFNSTPVAFKLKAAGARVDGTFDAGGTTGPVKGVRK